MYGGSVVGSAGGMMHVEGGAYGMHPQQMHMMQSGMYMGSSVVGSHPPHGMMSMYHHAADMESVDQSGEDMVGCDHPDCPTQWFRLADVGLTPETVPRGQWYCPDCRISPDDYTTPRAVPRGASRLGKKPVAGGKGGPAARRPPKRRRR
jgi:hypothetical protein